jgi:hypothetical protein
MRSSKALAKAGRWLQSLPITADDAEHQILRLFALAMAGASPARLRACGRKLARFEWFKHTGDPVAALLAHHALADLGCGHASLAELAAGYRPLLSDTPDATPLLCDLAGLPVASTPAIALPEARELVTAPREQIMELCRLITMTTSAGLRRIELGGRADLLPALAFSYARDWDLELACSLLRASAYLGLSARSECLWTTQWLLDQQNEDGSFGLLRAEAAHCGHDTADWPSYFERTVHAVWALGDTGHGPGLRRFVGPRRERQREIEASHDQPTALTGR